MDADAKQVTIYEPKPIGPMNLTPLKITLDYDVYQKVMYWIDKAQHREISGFGNVVQKDNHLRIISACLMPQKNTGTSSDIEPEDMAKAMYENRKIDGVMRWWWHSHVQMLAFWSGTDNQTIAQLGANGWFVCTVFNQKRERRTCFVSKDGTARGIFLDNLPLEVLHYPDPTKTAEMDAEYGANVKTIVYEQPIYSDVMWQNSDFWDGSRFQHERDDDVPLYLRNPTQPKTVSPKTKAIRGWVTYFTKDYGKVYVDKKDCERGTTLARIIETDCFVQVPLVNVYKSAVVAAEDLLEQNPETSIVPAYSLSIKIDDADESMIKACEFWISGVEGSFTGVPKNDQQEYLDTFLAILSVSVVNTTNIGGKS